jgi:hypothetical protein
MLQVHKPISNHSIQYAFLVEFYQDVARVLAQPIRTYNRLQVKFKSKDSIVDSTSFLLTTSINGELEKIEDCRIELYVATLVGHKVSSKLFDLSTPEQQVVLVQSDQILSKQHSPMS